MVVGDLFGDLVPQNRDHRCETSDALGIQEAPHVVAEFRLFHKRSNE